MERIKVIPAGGRLVDPVTREVIPETGKEVVMSSYWLRRINDGDAILVNTAQASEPVASTKKKPLKKSTDEVVNVDIV